MEFRGPLTNLLTAILAQHKNMFSTTSTSPARLRRTLVSLSVCSVRVHWWLHCSMLSRKIYRDDKEKGYRNPLLHASWYSMLRLDPSLQYARMVCWNSSEFAASENVKFIYGVQLLVFWQQLQSIWKWHWFSKWSIRKSLKLIWLRELWLLGFRVALVDVCPSKGEMVQTQWGENITREARMSPDDQNPLGAV